MKKFNISAVLAGLCLVAIGTANAAYPMRAGYNGASYAGGYPSYQNVGVNGQIMYMPSSAGNTMGTNTGIIRTGQVPNAASPSRVTGALPRVGSSTTNAGRQYYQPADYDRLADSGLYFGLSVGYSASVLGDISADYSGEESGFFAPGAFQAADFNTDTVIPLQLSVGAAINNNVRVDFSYSRYSKLGYPASVQTADGAGGFIQTQVTGGAITANTTMLNLYYNIDSYTGYLAGGMLRPYIGAGVGISLNTIADYVVYDNTFYSEMEPSGAGAGDLTGISDIYAYHNGGTHESLAFMLEGGVTTELDGGIKMDFFVRYANLGNVKTSGSIVVSQTEWLGDGAGGEYQAPYDSVYHYTNWYESGRLGLVDVGIRLRLQF